MPKNSESSARDVLEHCHDGGTNCLLSTTPVSCAFKILIGTGTSIGKRRLERPRRRWEDNIRMDLEEIGINTSN